MRCMRNTVMFNDRPAKRHKPREADGPKEELEHVGPQSRDARINTTPFIWWTLAKPSGAMTTLTCCLRCRRIPFHSKDETSHTKNEFYRWILAHQKKGCFASIDEYRKATQTTIQDITARRFSTTIAADVRKTDIRLGLKKKPKPKAAAKTETPASVSETPASVSEPTTPVSETASPKMDTESISKETAQALRDHSGPVEEGDTPPTLDDIVEMTLYDVRNYKREIAKLKDESVSAKAIATLHMQLASLRKEQEELKERFREDLAELDAFRLKQEYGKM